MGWQLGNARRGLVLSTLLGRSITSPYGVEIKPSKRVIQSLRGYLPIRSGVIVTTVRLSQQSPPRVCRFYTPHIIAHPLRTFLSPIPPPSLDLPLSVIVPSFLQSYLIYAAYRFGQSVNYDNLLQCFPTPCFFNQLYFNPEHRGLAKFDVACFQLTYIPNCSTLAA